MDAMYKQHGVVMPEMKDDSPAAVSSTPKESSASAKLESVDEELDDDDKKPGMEGCLLLIDYHKKRFQKRWVKIDLCSEPFNRAAYMCGPFSHSDMMRS